jgi:CelD/BcsL family acetyltransferase involved in cellulose biosynthesis
MQQITSPELSEATPGALAFSVLSLAQALDAWRNNAHRLTTATPQDIEFVSAWQNHVNNDCIAVVGTLAETGSIEFLLPLEVVSKGPLRFARYPGGSHANANFPATGLLSEQLFPESLTAATRRAISLARPDIDAVLLERQVEMLNGMSNRLVSERSGVSPNVALSFALPASFQELLKERNGAKKQKKMRQMQRRMDERGGWRMFKAATEAETSRVLDRFFLLKGERLKSRGLKDVFADPGVQAFFKALFADALSSVAPRYELHALEVGGEIAAVAGCTINGKHLTVEFGGICSSDRQLSPGDILYHLLIEQCCQRGFEIFDLGVGDEFYKRRWCDTEIWHRDTYLPLTVKGRIAVTTFTGVAAAKKRIKSSPLLFGLVKKLRGFGKARDQEAQSETEPVC